MKTINVGVRIDPDVWEGLEKQAAIIKRSRNNLLALACERINGMSEEELLVFLHPVIKHGPR
jgi:hypothetical protein